MQYCVTLKQKEILSHAATQMDLEGIMLSEISQSEILKTVWFYLHEVSKGVKFMEIESRTVVARSWVEGEWWVV